MTCEHAAEFISALCDGEAIPSEAALHLGGCESCKARLADYIQISVEMKRIALLEPREIPAISWQGQRQLRSSWWQMGRQTMRIPRFAFALMLVAIAALSTGFGYVRATAPQAAWFRFEATYPDGTLERVSLESGSSTGAWGNDAGLVSAGDGGKFVFTVRVVASKAGAEKLGIRAKKFPSDVNSAAALEQVRKSPEKVDWYIVGQKIVLPVEDSGDALVTGELLAEPPKAMQPLWFEFGFRYPDAIAGYDVQKISDLKEKPRVGSFGMRDGGPVFFLARAIDSKDGAEEIGIRAARLAPGTDWQQARDEIDRLPENVGWYSPGETASVPVTGYEGTAQFNAQILTQPPAPIDTGGSPPEKGELHLDYPYLLRDRRLIAEPSEGTVILTAKDDEAVSAYVPGDGLFLFSLSKLDGAVKGELGDGSIRFSFAGHSYLLLSGAPIAAGLEPAIWIAHLPGYREASGASRRESIKLSTMKLETAAQLIRTAL